MAFKQIKFIPLFALLATAALVAGEALQQEPAAVAAGAASGKATDVIASIQKDLKDIASEARSALSQIGNGVQKSQVAQALKSQLQEIVKQADDNGKKLAEGIASKGLSERVQELRDSAAVKAIVQDFESISSLVAGAAKQAAQNETGVKVGENLQNILNLSREAVGNLKGPQLTGAVSKGFDQVATQAQGVLDSVRKNPAAQKMQNGAQAVSGRLQKSLSGLSNQIKTGDLEKNVQGYLDGFADYAKSAANSISNLQTVKLLQNGLGSLGFGSGPAAATPKTAAPAAPAQEAEQQ